MERLAHEMARAPAGPGPGPLPGPPPPAGPGPPGRPRLGAGGAAGHHAARRLIYCPANLAPLASRRNVVVIHDVAPLREPELVQPRLLRPTSASSCPPIARRARLVITVSEFSRGEIVDLLPVCARSGCGWCRTAWTSASPPRPTPTERAGPWASSGPTCSWWGRRIARKNLRALAARRRGPAPASGRGARGRRLGPGLHAGRERARRAGARVRPRGAAARPLPRARPPWPCPRSTRASGCPASRPWPRARRWWPPTAAALPEVCGHAALLVDPDRPGGAVRGPAPRPWATTSCPAACARPAPSAPRPSPGTAPRG